MRFPPYLLGLIFGFVLGFTLTWEFFKNFQTNVGFGFIILVPMIILGLVYGIGDYFIWGNH